MHITRTGTVTALGAVTALVLVGCSGGNSANNSSGDSTSLTVNTSFTIETADPGNSYDPTGNTVAKALYETLVDFEGSDVSTPVPGLASWTQNDDATEFTFTIADGRTFSDGSPVEASDVVFSLERIQAMTEAKPAFLLEGLSFAEVDDSTVTVSSETPKLALPALLASPALGILNADVVAEHGGSTDGEDTAQEWLDANSAGSGPYTLDSIDLTSQITLAENPEYTGEHAPGYSRIVLRNVSESATQLINLKGGDADVALDLNGDQASGLGDGFTVDSVPSGQTIFLLVNQDDEVGGVAASPEFASAVRTAIDGDGLLELAGTGSVQATGVIPPGYSGALSDPVGQDLDATAAALTEAGYDGETIRLSFPNDYPVGGVEFTPLAERIQDQLKSAGINVELAPAPFASELDAYVNGTEQMGLWFWAPDYADSTNFLPFAPGLKVGLRAGWTAEDNPAIADVAAEAYAASSTEDRDAALSDFAAQMQESGPFIPLIVPASNIATADSVTGAAYNSVWTIDLAELAPAE